MTRSAEGPSFLERLLGRIAYPPAVSNCPRCGAAGGDPEASRRLARDARPGPAAALSDLARLCRSCRREELAARR